ICNKFGVAEIANERLPFEGGIFCRGDQLIIKLNAASPRTRQTFTLAHETAHLILAPQKAKGARRSFRCTDLESACDTVAAELLMPLEEIRVLASENASIDTLMNLARRFQVSLHAMAVRINDLKLWKHSIGFWRWNEGATELWFVGRRLWQTPKPYFNAFELAMQSQGAIKMSEQY